MGMASNFISLDYKLLDNVAELVIVCFILDHCYLGVEPQRRPLDHSIEVGLETSFVKEAFLGNLLQSEVILKYHRIHQISAYSSSVLKAGNNC
jgi:hypothetical protein